MPFGDTLFQRLRMAKRPDLLALLKVLKKDPIKFRDATDEDLVNAISADLRSAAGNSFANAVRARGPHDFSYKQILIDVADKLAPGRFSWSKFKDSSPESAEQIEDYIYERFRELMEEHLKAMNPADKTKLQEGVMTDLRARGLPENVVRGSLAAVATGTLTSVLAGPILASAIFTGLWTNLFRLSLGQLVLGGIAGGGLAGLVAASAIIASGTSYSKTIPAVIHLILIRLSREAEAKLRSDR